MAPINYYKKAPTFLFNMEGESELFQTQEEVDQAWEDGWFGPPWLAKKSPLISQRETAGDFESKAELKDAIGEDPRYKDLSINAKRSLEEIMSKVIEFEAENELEEVVVRESEE